MIDFEHVDSFASINEVSDLGQWDVYAQHGWLPKTQRKEKIYSNNGIIVETHWQREKCMRLQPAIFYFKIRCRSEKTRNPISVMLEVEEMFRLLELWHSIQTKGIKEVIVQDKGMCVRKLIYNDLAELGASGFTEEAMDAFIQKQALYDRKAEECEQTYKKKFDTSAEFVKLFSTGKTVKKTIDGNAVQVAYDFSILHLQNRKKEKKVQSFRIQVEMRGCEDEKATVRRKTAWVDLSEKEMDELLTNIWEGFQMWWQRKS